MSKITFRADDDLVDQLEGLEISKSEAMREALRSYLESDGSAGTDERPSSERDGDGTIDDIVRERVDERLETRLRELGVAVDLDRTGSHAGESISRADPRDVDITISLEGAMQSDEQVRVDRGRARHPPSDDPSADRRPDRSQGERESQYGERSPQCNQCGEGLDGDHVYCPNCGEKASNRLFCDCGDEVRSDWAFCPSCGRRTPAADVLESDRSQY